MTKLIGMGAEYQHEFEGQQRRQEQRSDRAIVFEHYRARLFGIAYRMLGSVEDAKDLIQETYLRWHQADDATVRSPEAWLVAVTTRLSIDRLRLASFERESYVGDWLKALLALVAEDATWTSDSGGRVSAARNVVHGPAHIVRFVLGIERKWRNVTRHEIAWINGEATVVTFVDGQLISTSSIETDGEGGRFVAFYRVLNPEKLRHALEYR